MLLMTCLRALLEGFSINSHLERPIGLKTLVEGVSDEELLNQLAEPIASTAVMLRKGLPKNALKRPSPAFVQVPVSYYSPQSVTFISTAK